MHIHESYFHLLSYRHIGCQDNQYGEYNHVVHKEETEYLDVRDDNTDSTESENSDMEITEEDLREGKTDDDYDAKDDDVLSEDGDYLKTTSMLV